MAAVKIRGEGVKLSLHLPLGLCLMIARWALGKKDAELARFLKAHGREVKRALKQYKKQNGRLTLLDIESADGTVVKMTV